MRLLLSIALLFLTCVVAPALARPNSPVVCDFTTSAAIIEGTHPRANNGVTRLSASSLVVAAGGSVTVSLQGSFTGFLVYVRSGNTHVGRLTPTGQNVGASSPCNTGVATGSTVGHNSPQTKTSLSWTWTAPTTPGMYQAVAMVTEGTNLPPVFTPDPVTITVQAAADTPTMTPVTGGTPAPVSQLLNTVLVRLQIVLSDTGASQLQSAIPSLVKQLQTAVQKAKAANRSPNANLPVQVVVTKATAAGSGSGSSLYSLSLGFVSLLDAQAFSDALTLAASPNATVRGRSPLLDGDITSQLQYDPNGLDAQGKVVIAPAQVNTVTCTDGTQVAQDLVQAVCPAQDTTAPTPTPTPTPEPLPLPGPAAAAGTTPTTSNSMSNGMYIGIMIGGIAVLLLGVGGFVYYQKSKTTNTVKPRV